MDLLEIPGIGDKTASALSKADINSLTDLLETYPRTYRLYQAVTANLQKVGLPAEALAKVGDYIVLKGHLSAPVSHRTARVTTQLATFQDHSGSLTLRWFNLPYLSRSVKPSNTYLVKGLVEEFRKTKQLVSPQLTIVSDDTPLTDQLVPIYRQMGTLKPWIFRSKIKKVLDLKLTPPDPLPKQVISKYKLLDYQNALSYIHHPPARSDLAEAIYRLSFQELYQLQLNSLKQKTSHLKLKQSLTINNQVIKQFINSLPFTLTSSQQTAQQEILSDLTSNYPMHRLLAGEVGSGKTIIATIAALASHSAGKRTLVMAPTVILAEQLFTSLHSYLEPLNLELTLITSGSKGTPTADIVIGTQALLNKDFDNIGLLIIDEQHRFGVKQREQLAQLATHTLMMTATPIPRSLALTLFNYLDLTKLTELPPGRLPVKTYVIPEHKRADSYTWLKQKLKSGNQVFVVTPLIEQAEENDQTSLKSIKELDNTLTKVFPEFQLDIMHGQMKDKEKTEHLQAFRDGHTQILVATSMIEVGIDIPSANIIIIEDAERFGLAQLHQLRGRVGRGGEQGYCLLFTNSNTIKSQERLKYFVRTNDGAKLAEYDLKDRGAGELFGTSQSGFFHLKLASIYDQDLLQATHAGAKLTLANSAISS